MSETAVLKMSVIVLSESPILLCKKAFEIFENSHIQQLKFEIDFIAVTNLGLYQSYSGILVLEQCYSSIILELYQSISQSRCYFP